MDFKTFQKIANYHYDLNEGYKILPSQKMQRKIERGERKQKSLLDFEKEHGDKNWPMVAKLKQRYEPVIERGEKISKALHSHDPVENRFKELENRDRGEKRRKTKSNPNQGYVVSPIRGKHRIYKSTHDLRRRLKLVAMGYPFQKPGTSIKNKYTKNTLRNTLRNNNRNKLKKQIRSFR